MRSFDIPGVGGIMIAPRTTDHLSFYEADSEIFLFRDVFEAFEICEKLLRLSFEERQVIRQKARLKSLGNHTYELRVSSFLKYIE
jgi:spore maturation protein CgeB